MSLFSSPHTYLDHASATQARPEAIRAFVHAQKYYANPGSAHKAGRASKKLLDDARAEVAEAVQTKEHTVLFTSSATEANNLAVFGIVNAKIESGVAADGLSIVCQAGVHSSLMEPIKALQKQGVLVRELKTEHGAYLISDLKELVDERTVLVALERVNAETGALFDTRSASRMAHQQNPHVVVVVDASQAPLIEQVHWTRLGADLLTLEAQKIGGVRGAGVLIKNTTAELAPQLLGGGQERGLRSGTEAVALAVAFSVALSNAQSEWKKFTAKSLKLSKRLVATLSKRVPQAIINAPRERAPHIISMSLPGVDTEFLAMKLSESGVYVSTKSTCDEDISVSRPVLAQTGDESLARSTLRVSFGRDSAIADVERFVHRLDRALREIDKHSK